MHAALSLKSWWLKMTKQMIEPSGSSSHAIGWGDMLREKGYVLISGSNLDEAVEYAKQLGNIIWTTDVQIRKSKGMLTSTRGLEFHTDHHHANYILWFCHQQTTLGGESVLVDAKEVISQMSDLDREVLRSINLFEHKIFDHDPEYYPLINASGDVYYSFWEYDKVLSANDRAVLDRFSKLLHAHNHINMTLQPNDILIINNRRMCHGRTEIRGTQNRHLKRYWISTEEKNNG